MCRSRHRNRKVFREHHNFQNRRVRINNDGSDPTTKSWFDALGRRVQKEQIAEGANWVKRYYFAGWHILHEISWASSAETTTHRWAHGPGIDEPLEYTDIAANPDKYYYYHEDRLGSIQAIADEQGVIKESYRYSEWGETDAYDASFTVVSDPEVSPIGNRWAFTARQLEEDTAEIAYLSGSRHLDTGFGRFLQRACPEDRCGISNLYVYPESTVRMRMTDPSSQIGVSASNSPAWPGSVVSGSTIGGIDESGAGPQNLSIAGFGECIVRCVQRHCGGTVIQAQLVCLLAGVGALILCPAIVWTTCVKVVIGVACGLGVLKHLVCIAGCAWRCRRGLEYYTGSSGGSVGATSSG